MPWITRGLSEGIVTTRYPRRPDGYGEGFRASIRVEAGPHVEPALNHAVEGCPTRAISVEGEMVRLDRGRCVLCGRCVERAPRSFSFDSDFELSTTSRRGLVVPHLAEDDDAVERTRIELARRVRALRRSVHIRHVDAGSDGADEWEIAALTGPIYDVHRLGIFFTASPRHADMLLVTGVGSAGMVPSLRETYEVMPEPKVVVAAGVEAISGGLLEGGYASRGGLDEIVPVDVFVPGSPPTPFGLLHGIMLATGVLGGADR